MTSVRCLRQEGVILVLVLWVVALLAVMATALGSSQRSQSSLTANAMASAQADALLEAGLYFMMARLEKRRSPTPENPWPVDGRLHPWDFDGHRLWIGGEPETDRLNVNRASGAALHDLFLSLELDPALADGLRDAILDWRDRDTVARGFGAEDGEYLAAGRPAGAADENFTSVDQLLLVKGMTRALFKRLRPHLTVHPSTAYRLFAEMETSDGAVIRRSMVVDVRYRTLHGYRILETDLSPLAVPPRAVPEEDEAS